MSTFDKERNLTKLALKQLKAGADMFNKWRISQGHKWIKLTDQTNVFDGRNLDGVNFTGVKLTGSTFRKSSLKGALFIAANVNKVDFSNSDLTGANFQGARMVGAILDNVHAQDVNFYDTLRDRWSILEIKCERCWITVSPEESINNWDIFKPREFEMIYGGAKVRVNFTEGFEPIDLLALPFYAKDIIDQFPNKRLVFAGLSTLGSPSLEFRVEDAKDSVDLNEKMQRYFEARHLNSRQEFSELVRHELESKNKIILELIDTYKHLLIRTKSMGDTYTQYNMGGGVQGKAVSKNQLIEFNFHEDREMAQLALDLDKLLIQIEHSRKATPRDKKALAEAADAARNKNSSKVMEALKGAGSWLVGFSKHVGVEMAAEALKNAISQA